MLPDVANPFSTTNRRFRDLVNAYVDDLGGIAHVGESKLGVLRALAWTRVQAEQLAAKMINGEEVDTGELCVLASTVLRLSVRVGLERREPRAGAPGLGALIRQSWEKPK
jgi:hypothetical protein